MRNLLKTLGLFGLVILLAHVAVAQSMMEHAAAAAGGSVAGVAGKKVSDGIDSILGKVNKQTDKAAKPAQESAPKPTPAAANAIAPGTTGGPLGPPRVNVKAKLLQPSQPKLEAAPALPEAPPEAPQPVAKPKPPEPPPVTPEQIAEIKAGASRQDVLAKLGNPFASIFMPEEGHMLEICQYAAKGKIIGTVRLTNGVVSAVRVN